MTEGPDATPERHRFGRRRRANAPTLGGRRHRYEVKVTPEEKAQLLMLALAQDVTVPRLLVESALAAEAGETASERRAVVVELFRAIRLLAAISNNVNQIAKATNATGELQAETVATLQAARRAAERVKATLEGLDPA